MKKISFSLIFAIFFLFSFTNAYVPYCSAANGDNSTCYQCYPGYSLVSGNCSCMISNCESCTLDASNSTACNSCSTYFSPKVTDNSTCYSCYLDGCDNCTLDAQNLPTCKNCSDGYFLQNNKCVQCSDVIPGCRYCNGTSQCLSCNIEYQYAYYSNGTNCVDCGSDTLSKNCGSCGNYDFYDNKNYTAYCRWCQDGYAFNNVTNFCSPLCNISNCKKCSNYKSDCSQCNDGYSWDYFFL